MSFSLTFFVVAAYVFPGALAVLVTLPLLVALWPPLSPILAKATEIETVPAIALSALAMGAATCLGAGFSDGFLFLARFFYPPESLSSARASEITIAADPKRREAFVYQRLGQLDLDAWAGRIRLVGASGVTLVVSGAGYLGYWIFGTPTFDKCALAGTIQIALGLCFVRLGCKRVEQYDHRVAGLAQLFARAEQGTMP